MAIQAEIGIYKVIEVIPVIPVVQFVCYPGEIEVVIFI